MPTSFNTASLDREPFSRWVARVSPRADRYASRIIRPPLRAGAGLARVVAARLTHMPSRSAVENAAFDPTRWLPTWPYRVLGSGAVNCCEAAARPEPRPTVAQPIIIVASEPTARPQPEADGDAAPPVYVSSGIRDPDAALRLPRQRLGARTMNVRLPARSTRYTRMSGRSARRSATRTGRVSASTRDRP